MQSTTNMDVSLPFTSEKEEILRVLVLVSSSSVVRYSQTINLKISYIQNHVSIRNM